MSIPLRPVQPAVPAAHRHEEAPYQAYIFGSLMLAIGGGFALAVLLPLAQALKWDWGRRWLALVQAHGQLQLLGFAGLYVMGMAFRLMPRFSGRPLAYPTLVRAALPLIAASLVLRSIAEPAGDSIARDAALLASAALLMAGALAFVAVVLRILARPDSRAEATGWFYLLGAIAYAAAAVLNFALVIEMVRDSLPLVQASRDQVLVFVQLYGFLFMFFSGTSTRAVPSLTGRPRAAVLGRVTAAALASGVLLYSVAALRASYASLTETSARVEDAGLLIVALAFVSVVWMTGVFHPRADRVAAASRYQFQLVRAAMAWLAFASLLTAWYAARALRDGTVVDAFELDAIRHSLTVGVLTMMIAGLGMMIVPEFAGRRLQHPNENWIVVAMLLGLNAATLLRVWPAIEGVNWLATTRYWPMAAAGALAETAVAAFAFMFVQSYFEQRTPGWGSADALVARRGGS